MIDSWIALVMLVCRSRDSYTPSDFVSSTFVKALLIENNLSRPKLPFPTGEMISEFIVSSEHLAHTRSVLIEASYFVVERHLHWDSEVVVVWHCVGHFVFSKVILFADQV